MKTFNNIADFYQSVNIILPSGTDFSVHNLVDLHHHYPFQSPDFRANYFTVVIVKSGEGFYRLDGQQYKIKQHTVYFTNPGHIKGFELQSEIDAIIITFSESFLLASTGLDAYDQFPFLLAETAPPSYLLENNFDDIDKYAHLALEEFKASNELGLNILKPLLVIILSKIKNSCWNQYSPRNCEGASSEIVNQFKRLLERHFSDLNDNSAVRLLQVQTLAANLHLNTTYLSSLVKLKTGQPISQWIAERTLLEAEGLLIRSRMSIQQIGYHLGFSEPTHFTKYFKKHRQVTPSKFRKSHL